MLEWFSLAFPTPVEQGKLFTIAVSTSVAICIVLLNQWFISRRAKKERVIIKVEELTNAIHTILSSSLAAGKLFLLERTMDEDSIAKFEAAQAEIETLCPLYFRKNPISTDSLSEILDLIKYSKKLLTDDVELESNHREDTYMTLAKNVNKWAYDADKVIYSLIKKHIK
jgi:hypothetical protein